MVTHAILRVSTSHAYHRIVVTAQVLDFSFCVAESGPAIWAVINDSLQFTLAAVMCLLVTTQFVRQSFQLHKVAKRWQLNGYVNLFAREGMLYFLAYVHISTLLFQPVHSRLIYCDCSTLLFGLVNVLVLGGNVPTTGWRALPIGILEYVPVFTLTPRFILSMRALYHDARDIDTEFGFTSVPGRSLRETAIVFADAGQNEEELEDEEIPMGETEMRNAGSNV